MILQSCGLFYNCIIWTDIYTFCCKSWLMRHSVCKSRLEWLLTSTLHSKTPSPSCYCAALRLKGVWQWRWSPRSVDCRQHSDWGANDNIVTLLWQLTTRIFMVNLLQTLIFRSCILCYGYKRWHWKQKSLKTLFGKYLDHMQVKFEQNCMVRNIQKFELIGKKWLSIFEKLLKPFWKTCLWHKHFSMMKY